MQEIGTVIKLKDKYAVVRIERKSACNDCGMCAFGTDKPHIDITVLNTIKAKENDKVILEMQSGNIAKISIIAYFVPLLFGGAAFIISSLLNAEEWVMLIALFVGVGLGFIPLRIYDKKWGKR
jgi:Positive regulator of sigma E activity